MLHRASLASEMVFRENTSCYLMDSQRTSVGGALHSKYVHSHHPHSADAETVCNLVQTKDD